MLGQDPQRLGMLGDDALADLFDVLAHLLGWERRSSPGPGQTVQPGMTHPVVPVVVPAVLRIVALAGVAYVVLAVIGNGTIGKIPDSDTPTARLATYYAIRHAGVERGGVILDAARLLRRPHICVWAIVAAVYLTIRPEPAPERSDSV